MRLADFSGKKVALLGAGIENLSIVPHLIKTGATVTLCEQFESEIPAPIKELLTLKVGADHLEGIGDFDVLIRAPGLPISRVDQALVGCQQQPIRTSTIDVLLAEKSQQVIGVTGSKGKGTTSTLLGSMLEAAGKKVIVAGNIGRPIFNLWDEITPDTILVMELSSFQLEDVTHSPHVAIMLPISANDHLEPLSQKSPNFHATTELYARAKAQITAFQTEANFFIFAADNSYAATIAKQSRAKKIAVSAINASADVFVNSSGALQLKDQVIELAPLGLRGVHNFFDAALAAAAAQVLGADSNGISQGVRNFRPLPHRLETVGTRSGVTFVDDSYATAPEATIAALTAFDQPVVWIGGGSTKGASFAELATAIAKSTVSHAVLLGQEAPKIKQTLEQLAPSIPVTIVASLKEAVSTATTETKPNSVVLLSPACASKDMFLNAADRGQKFQELVNALPV